MTKKIVALLLVIATLCLPFCGLANTPKTIDEVAEWFLSSNLTWLPMDTEVDSSLKDWIVIGWLNDYNTITMTYKGKTYFYSGMDSETILFGCLGMLIACEGATYMKNWAFYADDKTYTENQVSALLLQLALKGANK
ncbi:MAG: hypothetical protein KIG71_01995 [Eubacteriales bacterium]|mgnify:FL=1|nr:hypothetical protein [Eubacteriales bacterium]